MTVLGTILTVVVCIVVAALLAIGWASLDKKEEKRRKAFGKLSGTLRTYGLTRLPDMLDDYSVGDYSGFFQKLYKFADMLDDGDDVVVKDFNQVFDRVLSAKAQTPEGRAYVKTVLAKYEPAPATVVAAVTPAPVPAAVIA